MKAVALAGGTVRARPASGIRQRILFLGNSHNRFSVGCLKALVELGLDVDVVVGSYDSSTQGAWRLIRSRLKRRGGSFVLGRAILLAKGKILLALRRAGVPLRGFASVPELCQAYGLKTLPCSHPNSAEFLQQVRSLEVDLIVVAAFGHILKPALIEVPRLGCVNVHPSLLPRYRGPEPFYWVLANDEEATGVTLHYMDEGIDSGDVILQKEFEIAPGETEITLRERAVQKAAELLGEALPALLSGKAQRVSQDHSAASYYSFPPRGAPIARSSHRTRPLQGDRLSENTCASFHAIDPLRDPRWSAFVAKHPRASIFHTVAWLDALRRTYGYEPIVYTTSPAGADLQNGVVFCRTESRITGRRLVSLPFSDYCEPLVESAEELRCILRSLQACQQSEHWKYVEIRPLSNLECSSAKNGFRPSRQYYLHTIDLQLPEDELFRQFHKSSVQYRVRKAEEVGLTYECGRSDSLLHKFYPMILTARRRHRVPPQPEEWFRNLATGLGDAFEIHVASHNNTVVAAIVTVRFKNTVLYKYGGSDQAYHRFGSVPFLLWRAIQKAKSTGAQTFDLGRSDYLNQGLLTFKGHWASTRAVLTYWRFPGPAGGPAVDDSRVVRGAKCVFGLLPNSMLKVAGKILYRHIG